MEGRLARQRLTGATLALAAVLTSGASCLPKGEGRPTPAPTAPSEEFSPNHKDQPPCDSIAELVRPRKECERERDVEQNPHVPTTIFTPSPFK